MYTCVRTSIEVEDKMALYNSNVDIILRGLLGGQVCENHLEYHAEAAVSGIYAHEIAQEAFNTIWAVLKEAVSEEYTLLQITAITTDSFIGGGTSNSWILDCNVPGEAVGDVLPPHVTARIVKVVNNGTIDPVDAEHFKNGFTGFSGVIEGHQNNGILNSTGLTAWQLVADSLMSLSITIGGTPYTWDLGMERGELNPVKALVFECQASQRLGSRNSRKR